MIKRQVLAVFGLLLLVLLTPALAEIRVVTKSWPGFTNEDGTGGYFAVVELVLAPKAGELKLEFSNFNRALVMVEKQQADMVLAVTRDDSSKLLLSAKPLDFDTIVAVYAPSVLAGPLKPDELAKLRLAWDLAYNYGEALGLTVKGYEVHSVAQGLELVAKGRIDVYLAEQADLILHTYQAPPEGYKLQQQIMAQVPVYVGFSGSERGALLKKRWDNNFATLHKSGALQQLYQQYPGMHFTQP
jgi:polar amino acid transport system substrate-binding protein